MQGLPTLDNQYHPRLSLGIKHTRHCAKYLHKKFDIFSKKWEITWLKIHTMYFVSGGVTFPEYQQTYGKKCPLISRYTGNKSIFHVTAVT